MSDDAPGTGDERADGRSPHEEMERYVELADDEQAARREKEAVRDQVGERLAGAVEDAAEATGVNVEVASTSADGRHQTLRARLDRAALVAAVTRSLPDGFVVEHVNEDGTLTVAWDERDTVPDGRKHSAILKAIVAEETITDADGFIVDVPTREAVLDRAVELDVPRAAADRRLDHLQELDVIDIASDGVYPDTNFSRE